MGRSVGTCGKRSGGIEATPEAKRAKVDPVEDMLTAVTGGLSRAASVSESSREMLRLMSPGCLGTPADERHEYQVKVATMLQEVLGHGEETMRSVVDCAAAEVERAASTLALRSQDRVASVATHTTQISALQEAKASFRKENRDLQSARRSLDEAIAVQQREDATALAAAASRKALQEALQEHIPQLASGSGAGQGIESVVKVSEAVGIEESLVQAFLVVARKRPEARSAFDGAVLRQLEGDLSGRLAGLEATVVEAPGASERAAAVVQAEAAFEAARQRMAASAASLRGGEIQAREAEAGSLRGELVERAALGELRRLEAKHERAESDLEDFRRGPIDAFQSLAERRSAPVPEASPGPAGASPQ
mmetsp:Transcript_33330/g.70840  ORF Transcript_33330/g.70840 Transcript_33330/m.70840 type:complete len:365 (+) Transcript_33330:52-1146(+)